MKKLLSIFLSVTLLIGTICSAGAFTVSADDDGEEVYNVILTSLFNYPCWNDIVFDETNQMTYDPESGLYKLTVYDVQPENDIGFSVYKNHYVYPISLYSSINVDVISECDILVTYDPETKTVDIFGDGIRERIYAMMITTVGNGFRGYLNNKKWDVNANNLMTETSDGVWEMTCENVLARDDYEAKFYVRGTQYFDEYFGAEEEKLYPTGEELDAVYSLCDANSFIFSVPENGSTVHFKLDLRGFNHKYKERNHKGAKLTITVTPPEEPVGDIYGLRELYLPYGDSAEIPMTLNEETGKYELTIYNAQPRDVFYFEVIKNHYKSYRDPDTENDPFVFDIPTVCDVTISFDPDTGRAEVNFSPPDPPGGDVYTAVMASDKLTVISGELPMTFNEETGLYELTVYDVAPRDALFVAVMKNHNEIFGSPDAHYQPIDICITSTCDVTITFDPVNEIVDVKGNYAQVLNDNGIWDIMAVGSGRGGFLNGVGFAYDGSNSLEYKSKGIWEITYKNVPAGDNYQVKFAVNNDDELNEDTHYFGAQEDIVYPCGEELEAVFSDKSFRFSVPENNSTVTLRLDLWDYHYFYNRTAKLKIIVTPPDESVPTLLGDVNGDSVVDIFDAVIIQKYTADLIELSEEQKNYADFNGDNTVDILDAAEIQKYAVV